MRAPRVKTHLSPNLVEVLFTESIVDCRTQTHKAQHFFEIFTFDNLLENDVDAVIVPFKHLTLKLPACAKVGTVGDLPHLLCDGNVVLKALLQLVQLRDLRW